MGTDLWGRQVTEVLHKYNMWRPLLCLLLVVGGSEAIKFKSQGVSVPDGVLRVGEATNLGCEYIMWRQERLYSVTWSIKYSGVKSDFFVYQASGGKEVTPGVSLLVVNPGRSEDKTVNLQVTDGREEEVTICCDVKVLRDDGYGTMTTMEKEKCSAPIRVEGVERSRELVSVMLDDVPEKARLREVVALACEGRGMTSYHSLQLVVNGQEVAARDGRARRVEYALTLHPQHFSKPRAYSYGYSDGEQARVGCLMRDARGEVVANITRSIKKDAGGLGDSWRTPVQSYDTGRHGGLSRDTRYPGSEEHQSHPTNVPCHSYLLVEETRGGSVLKGRLIEVVMEELTGLSRTARDR